MAGMSPVSLISVMLTNVLMNISISLTCGFHLKFQSSWCTHSLSRILITPFQHSYTEDDQKKYSYTMLFQHYMFLSLLASLIQACHPQLNPRADNHNQTFPITLPGPDIPPSPSTTGYFLNHAALNVRNLTRSVAWYRDILGFQVLFTFRASSRYSVVYLGHSHSPRADQNATLGSEYVYQTATQLTEAMMNGTLRGLLELVHFDRAPDIHNKEGNKNENENDEGDTERSTTPAQRFSHLGLIVPDILAAQQRFENLGTTVLKRVGELPDLQTPVQSNPYGLLREVLRNNEEEAKLISEALRGVLLVLDPDGNLIEVQSFSGGRYDMI